MTKREEFIERLKKDILLFDGGIGTEFYNRGVFINKCFDELNLSNKTLVRKVHEDYKKSGADIIQTNTFGANYPKLERYQLQDSLYEINFEGARIAREVADDDLMVAGSLGPLGVQIEPLGPISREETREFFSNQIKALVSGGVDLLLFETFIYPEEMQQAIIAARQECDLPIIAQITIDDAGRSLTGATVDTVIRELESFGPDVLGTNCTVGPQVMLSWLEQARKLTKIPISIMPNAGKPKSIDGRNIYLASPEYLGEYAKHYIQSGANIIGGCCGTGPEHIKRMRNTLNALKPQEKSFSLNIQVLEKKPDIELIEPKQKSRLARRISEGHFVKMVEILSPHGVSPVKEIDKAREMYYCGIDAINIPDGPRASARMSAMALAVKIQRGVGIETILHYVCRDRNVIGIQSDLLGAYALGLKNILAITGDPPKLGDYPDATAVFDVDSIGLSNIINRLNHGMDIAGNPIGQPTGFFTGVGVNPGAVNLDEELNRLRWKVDAGAEYMITQPVFDLEVFQNFLEKTEDIKIPLIAGIWPLVSIRNAEFMNNEIPGCHVPDNILERLRKHQGSKEDSLKAGIDIAKDVIDNLYGLIQGVQISAPFGRVQSAIDVLDGFTF